MPQKLVTNYEVKSGESGCHPGSEWHRISIILQNEITELLPYLNTALGGRTDYRHDDQFLLWNHEGKKYAFRSNEIVIAPVFDNDEAKKLTESLIERINNIWIQKDNITPNIEGRKALLNVIDIVKLLPKTNCRECGLPGCMAFATALRNDPAILASCPFLPIEGYTKLLAD